MVDVVPYVCMADGLADVIAILYLVDGKTTEVDVITSYSARWQMSLPLCYVWQMVSCYSLVNIIADVIAKWQME